MNGRFFKSARWLIPLLLLALAACVRDQPQVIVITATFPPSMDPGTGLLPGPEVQPEIGSLSLSPVPDMDRTPTPDALYVAAASGMPAEHVVQPGDTLFGIATRYNLTMDMLVSLNNLENPNLLSVGQVLRLPDVADNRTPYFKIIPDSRLVRGPGSSGFDIAGFISQQPGYIRLASDTVSTGQADGRRTDAVLTAAQIVRRVSLEYSVDPRLLLALLEYRAGWLSSTELPEELRIHPLIHPDNSPGVDRSGLYRQLAWAANELNRGYYGWKYRRNTTLVFSDNFFLAYDSGLNAGTVGVQYFLSLHNSYENWLHQIGQDGFYRLYYAYFGNPFPGAVDPIVPPNIEQPPLALPFAPGEVWFYTGGPHGGWGGGSAWSAIDMAPPDEWNSGDPLCYTSQHWVTAVAPGVIARSGEGLAVLDLDNDGDESTGWSILYLHLAADGLVPAGTRVLTGDPIGRPSCAGGFSSATHLHIARRYNGEWIPADCSECPVGQGVPDFVMGGWRIYGIPRQEYQGFMEREGTQLQAAQGRQLPGNRISW